jgi:hypothetical protein
MSHGKTGRSRQRTGTIKPYRPPTLTVHGNIEAITRRKKGTKADGTRKPRTRASGGNA